MVLGKINRGVGEVVLCEDDSCYMVTRVVYSNSQEVNVIEKESLDLVFRIEYRDTALIKVNFTEPSLYVWHDSTIEMFNVFTSSRVESWGSAFDMTGGWGVFKTGRENSLGKEFELVNLLSKKKVNLFVKSRWVRFYFSTSTLLVRQKRFDKSQEIILFDLSYNQPLFLYSCVFEEYDSVFFSKGRYRVTGVSYDTTSFYITFTNGVVMFVPILLDGEVVTRKAGELNSIVKLNNNVYLLNSWGFMKLDGLFPSNFAFNVLYDENIRKNSSPSNVVKMVCSPKSLIHGVLVNMQESLLIGTVKHDGRILSTELLQVSDFLWPTLGSTRVKDFFISGQLVYVSDFKNNLIVIKF
jgi:hypothetical protein